MVDQTRRRRATRHDPAVSLSVARLERRLLAQAELFEDARAYRAGVEDALRAVRPLLARGRAPAEAASTGPSDPEFVVELDRPPATRAAPERLGPHDEPRGNGDAPDRTR